MKNSVEDEFSIQKKLFFGLILFVVEILRCVKLKVRPDQIGRDAWSLKTSIKFDRRLN